MKKKFRGRRGVALAMVLLVLFAATPQSYYGADDTAAVEETYTIPAVSETENPEISHGDAGSDVDIGNAKSDDKEIAQEDSAISAQDSGMDGSVEDNAGNSAEDNSQDNAEQSEAEEKTEAADSDPVYADLDISRIPADLDFSSARLLARLQAEDLVDPECVISSYQDLYLLQYDSVENAQKAYAYYSSRTDYITPDYAFTAAEETDEPDAEPNAESDAEPDAEPDAESVAESNTEANSETADGSMQGSTSETAEFAEGKDPLTLLSETDVRSRAEDPVIALIDTGVSASASVRDSVSMIGDNTEDDNGHGEKMLDFILAENKDAQILSIKAMDSTGHGTVSGLYAAIEYAIEAGVSIINLSLSAPATEENSILTEVVNRAVSSGISVVAAAGNQGYDASCFVPGNIDSAIVVGAADDSGNRVSSSNYGNSVDFYVKADSTSEAAARMSGYLSAGNAAAADNHLVFTPGTTIRKETSEPAEAIDEIQNTAETTEYSAVVKYTLVDAAKLTPSATIESVMEEGLAGALLTQVAETVPVYRAEDGRFRFFAGEAWANGLAAGPVTDYVFAKANDGGHVLTSGVSLDTSTMIAEVDESCLSSADVDDFADIQLQVLVPVAAENPESTFKVTFTDGSYTKENLISSGIYDKIGIDLGTGNFAAEDLSVSVNGEAIAAGLYEIRRTEGHAILCINRSAADVFAVRIVSAAKVSDDFEVALEASDYAVGIIGELSDFIGYLSEDLYSTIDTNANTINGQSLTLTRAYWTLEKLYGHVDEGNRVWLDQKDLFTGCYSTGYESAGGKYSRAQYIALPIRLFDQDFTIYDKSGKAQYSTMVNGYNAAMPMWCSHLSISGYRLEVGEHDTYIRLLRAEQIDSETKELTFAVQTREGVTGLEGTSSMVQAATTAFKVRVRQSTGTAYLKKVSAKPEVTDGNDNYSLSGAVYGVYTDRGCSVEIARLTTDGKGVSDTIEIEAGTYYVKEIKAPKGYQMSDVVKSVTVTPGKTSVVEMSDEPVIGYLTMKKSSKLPTISSGNSHYSLKDAVYTVYRDKACAKQAGTLTTKEDGTTNTLMLPLGTYYIKETKAPKNYFIDSRLYTVTLTEANKTVSTAYKLAAADEPGNDPITVLLRKKDGESKDGKPQGTASLAGAQYTVRYYDVDMDTDPSKSGYSAKYTWVFQTDANGIIRMDDSHYVSGSAILHGITGTPIVPLGTLTIRETKAPAGYSLDPTVYVAQTTMKNDVVQTWNLPNTDTKASMEPVIRGDLNFIKVNEDSEPMSGIPFLITSKTTGESHVIVSDANGHVDTSSKTRKHSSSTNGNDTLLAQNTEGGYYITDESRLNSAAGIWFGNPEALSDASGALPYDDYVITEIPVEGSRAQAGRTTADGVKITGNYGKNLWESVTGASIREDGTNITMPNEVWVNREILFKTIARNSDMDTKVIPIGTAAGVTDTVRYQNLTVGDSYTMKGQLINRENGEVLAEASTKFSPTEKSGTVDVVFKNVDTTGLEGTSLVVYETLLWKGGARQEHADPDDTDQIVYVPAIRTKNIDAATGDAVAAKNKDGASGDELDHIIDTVTYSNLPSGEVYVLKGQLADAATGEILAEAESGDFSVRRNAASGTKEIEFVLDAGELEGHTLVAYETLFIVDADGILHELAAERTIDNQEQQICYPKIGTEAADADTMDHTGTSAEQAVIVDTVDCENLVVGKEYTIKGILMNKNTGEELLVNGETVTAATTFTADSDRQKAELTFSLDASALEGTTVVAFEELYHNDVLVESHTDLNDEAQTVHFPKVCTSARDNDTADDVGVVGENVSLTDHVSLANLIPGQTYTVRGILKNQSNGETVMKDGAPVTQTQTFTVSENGTKFILHKESDYGVPDENTDKEEIVQDPADEEWIAAAYDEANRSTDGTIDLVFTLDSTWLENRSVVVFEDLIHNDVTVAVHNDLTDQKQTVHYPELHTNAVDMQTGDHVGSIFGSLINKIRAILGDRDVTDDGIPDETEATVYDTVTLNNLVPGRTYTISGILMNQETGEPVLQPVIDTADLTDDAGTSAAAETPVTQSAVVSVTEDGRILAEGGEKTETAAFDADHNTVSGSVVLTFKFDSSLLQGESVVVFEDLIHNDVTVAVHEDINDSGQSIHEMSVHTMAIDAATGDHVGNAPVEGDISTIIDTVSMEKLVKGAKYTVTGSLVDADASTEDRIVYLTNADGEVYTSGITFTADEEHLTGYAEDANGETVSGSVKLYYTMNPEAAQGKTVVVFEDLYHNDVKIATHSDITDADQSVYYPTGKTNAVSDTDGLHQEAAGKKKAYITDRVYFENLKVGEAYTITGTLHYRDDVDLDGDGIIDHKAGDPLEEEGAENSITFTASGEMDAENLIVSEKASGEKTVSGYVNITFCISTKNLEGTTLVAFENFSHNDVDVFTHNNLDDKPQSIRIPKIRTSAAVDGLDETSVYNADGTYRIITLTDTVSYENLWSTAELAELKEDGQHILPDDKRDVYEIDENASYVLKGVLMDQETGKPFVDAQGNTCVSWKIFTADEADGSVDVVFRLNPEDLENLPDGKTLVVYETLYRASSIGEIDDARPLAEHKDLTDTEQDIRFPKGRTHATVSDSDSASHEDEKDASAHEVKDAEKVRITDRISYENLHADTEYTVTGALQVVTETDKDGRATAWEAAVDDAGNPITQTVTFTTPDAENDSADGSVDVVFAFSGTKLAGKTTVVFETVTREGKEVLIHADINDAAQTIIFPENHKTLDAAQTAVQTGDNGPWIYVAGALTAFTVMAGLLYSRRKRRVRK